MKITSDSWHLTRAGRRRRDFLKTVAVPSAAATLAASVPAWAQGARAAPPSIRPQKGSIIETLARYATSLQYEDLPSDVVHQAKRTLIDTMGCAIGGFNAAPSQIAIKLAANISAPTGATILGTKLKTSPDLATFANGVMIRYLDFNDGYIGRGSGHPSDVIAPILPAAGIAGRNGRDLILGIVLAYEIYCRVTDVFDNQAIGMDYAPLVGLAAAPATGRLLGLTTEQIAHATAITFAGGIGVGQIRRGAVSNWKACSSAEACRDAIFAVQLAQAGMTGPNQVFEGREGFFNLVKLSPFALPEMGGKNKPFAILHSLAKRFAIGQYAQTAAQAALEARAFIKDVDYIAEVNLHVSRRAIKIMADTPDKWAPRTKETADHSLPYVVAVLLADGKIDDESYDDAHLKNERLLALVGRIHCIPSDEADRKQPDMNLCEFQVVLKSGERRTFRVEYQRGHWRNPMTDGEVEDKFRSLASRHFPRNRVDKILRILWSLDELKTTRSLVTALRI